MKSSQRAFIHTLAEDYGLDSESQDPEPYRNVVVMKGHKFIGAPKKSIAEYIKTSHSTKPSAAPANAPLIEQLRKPGRFNALVLHGLRIGLLTSELEKELAPLLYSSQLRFNIHWSGDEEVVLNPIMSSFGADEVELELNNIKPVLRRLLVSKNLAQDVELCGVGKDGKVSVRESSNTAPSSSKSWTTLASRSTGTSSPAPLTWSRPGIPMAKNGFSALDPAGHAKILAAAEAKKKEERERKDAEKLRRQKEKERMEVVDDWEAAADEEEKSEGLVTPPSGSVNDVEEQKVAPEEKKDEEKEAATPAEEEGQAEPVSEVHQDSDKNVEEKDEVVATASQ